MYIDVLIELKAQNLDKTFTYAVPNNLQDRVKKGVRVYVPFGNQKLEGFVLEIRYEDFLDYDVKEIIDVIDENPVLNDEMIKLGKYISMKTLSSLISSYQTMLPVALKAHKNFKINKKYDKYLELLDFKYVPKNANQKEIIEKLKGMEILKSELIKISKSSVDTLIKNKVIKEISKEVYRLNNTNYANDKKNTLTPNQESVVNEVSNSLNSFTPFLLHGVTGSGKTEVYMHIIEKVLKLKKEVIVLVPEISLTPQLVEIFRSRFKNSIAILHSRLSDGEKYDEWRKIEKKEVSIAIGARSAIFAPFTNLGLIVLDEEHSDTYKQENNPKYDAIDIAIKRSKYHNCPLVLGSATPSIESYTRAKSGVYKLLELKQRINKTMPNIEIVDMKGEFKKGNSVLSEELIKDISDRLKKDEQVILLLNRRGYSTVLQCRECGYVIKCPNCDIPLTYHKVGNKLNCHYCNYTTFKISKCPSCNSSSISDFGLGTQRLEEIVNELFPNAKVLRMDIDTTTKKGSHERIIRSFKEKKYNILIGTQMISKGLDFSDVTLVGVVNGDSSLNMPDYRSAERTFSLLSQVSGRSGRALKSGKVIIQCFNTEHYSIKNVKNNDYNSFYIQDMSIRKKLNYPPYFNLCLIKLTSIDYNLLISEANKIKEFLLNNSSNVQVLGPSVGIIPKLNNKYNMQLIIKYKNISQIYNTLCEIKKHANRKIFLDIDFNPKKI